MNFLIFVAGLAAVIVVVLLFKGKTTSSANDAVQQSSTEVKTDITIYTGILDRETENVFIAGLEHHCSKKDVGWFTGKIFNEADNPYDKKAMAIGCIQSKKIIGYVPSAILTEYRKWCGRKDCRCVGYIFHDGEHLRGRVRAYLPDTDQDKLVQDVESYIKQTAEHFGWNVDGLDIEI